MPARILVLLVAVLAVAAAPPRPEPIVTSSGSVTVNGSRIDYQSTSGRLSVKDKTGKATANVFFIAYTKPGADPKKRPVTFCFNGGPGSSSVWLHMGVFGPKRILLADDGRSAATPAQVVPNEWSILDLTDLVFIDPVSTGYSRADEQKDAKLFHGVEEDISSVGDFIRLYTARYKRGASPKYLAGESYGTTRSAGLSSYLDRAGMKLNGIVLVSSVLDFQTITFGEGNDVPYPLFLPTYTAAAWYHGKLDRSKVGDLTKVVEESRRFAEGEYSVALRKGVRIAEDERKAIAKRLSRLTSLSEKAILDTNLRIEAGRFRGQLLREGGKTIGRYDSRITGTAGKGKGGGRDPSETAIREAFTKGLETHLVEGLGYKTAMRYNINSGNLVQPWNYGQAGNRRSLNVAPRLRQAMQNNPSLKVFVANGYYDLATPFAATEYTMSHLGPKSVTDRVTLGYYEAGHMMYTNKECLKQLKADLAKFMGGPEPVGTD